MRIQTAQHAVDRGFNKFGVVGLFDILRPHLFENVSEEIELAINLWVGRRGLVAARHVGIDQPDGNACKQ